MESEKRRTPRYVFFAAAELMEEKSEVRIASRLSELSLRGCYLDMMNPFPVSYTHLDVYKRQAQVGGNAHAAGNKGDASRCSQGA